jgi:hypothetical protein
MIGLTRTAMSPWLLIFASLCLALAHGHAQAPAGPKPREPLFMTDDEVGKFLESRFASGKPAVFQSRDGKHYGMDSDATLSLDANGEAILGEYGVAPMGYRGTYEVKKDGTIAINLKGYRGTWPEMRMARERDGVRLYPKSGDRGLVFGNRGGAVETSGMKSFWPFRLVEGVGKPTVSPIYTGSHLQIFASPILPEDFAWHGDLVRFRLDFDLTEEGKAAVRKHYTNDVASNEFHGADWRIGVVKCATKAMESWKFAPMTQDGKPVKTGGSWNFILMRVDGEVRWIIQDDIMTVFDNMPRLPVP